MKNILCLSTVLTLAAPLVSHAETTVDTTVLGQVTITVGAEDPDYTLKSADITALGADKTLIKMGKGRLIVATDLNAAGYDGEILIKEGYFRAKDRKALGGNTKGTTVSSGATLEVDVDTPSASYIFGYETVTISGSGVDGHGAVYAVRKDASIATNMMFAGGKVILADDTTVGYFGEESYDGSCGFRWTLLDMNGHTLTFNKGTTSGFYGIDLSSGSGYGGMLNPGNITVAVAQTLTFENNASLEGSSGNVLRVADGTTLYLNNNNIGPRRTPWTLQADGDVTLQAVAGGTSKGWSGPISVAGTLKTKGEVFLPSVISGAGGITVESGTLTLLEDSNPSGVNTYAGTTLVKSGATLKAGRLSLVPDAATTLTLEAGAKANLSSAADTELTDVTLLGVLDRFTAGLYDTPQDLGALLLSPDGHAITSAVSGPMSLVFGGPSTVTVAPKEVSDKPHVIAFPGNTTILTGKGKYGYLEARGGTIEIAAGAEVDFSDNDVFAGADYPAVGRISVRGTLAATPKDYSDYKTVAGLDMGRNLIGSTSACRGIFEMFDGAVVTGKLENALAGTSGNRSSGKYNYKGAMGSYFIHGGKFVSIHGPDGADACPLGDTYRGFYVSIEGGEFLENGAGRIGYDSGASGVIHQSGGLYKRSTAYGSSDCRLALGMNSAAVDFLISGGQTMTVDASIVLCPELNGNHGERGHYSTLSIIGGDASFALTLHEYEGWRSFSLAGTVNMDAILNLGDGGVLSVPSVKRVSTARGADGREVDIYTSGSHAFVNFDGGVLEANHPHTMYRRTTMFEAFSNGVDRVTAFEKGAVLRTDIAIAIGASIQAPEGNGIEAIPLPAEIVALGPWAYTGAPRVRISDATGSGASAVALFDTINGLVTNILVTSRGNNYSNPTVTIERGGYSPNGSPVSFTATAVLTPNVSGGLVKEGKGTLTVDQPCTYTGVTTVAGGVLKLGAEGVIASSSGIHMAGGTLDPNGTSFNLPVVGGVGTIDAGGLTAADELVFDAEDLINKEFLTITGTLTINPGTKVRILNAEKLLDAPKKSFKLLTTAANLSVTSLELVGDLAGTDWCVLPTDGGRGLRVAIPVGMAVIVR